MNDADWRHRVVNTIVTTTVVTTVVTTTVTTTTVTTICCNVQLHFHDGQARLILVMIIDFMLIYIYLGYLPRTQAHTRAFYVYLQR